MSSNKRRLFRKNFLLFVCIISFLITVTYYLNYDYPENKFPDPATKDFLVNTTGCRIPAWNPWDDSIRSLFQPVWGPYKCPGKPSFLRVLPNAIVSLDDTLIRLYYEVDPLNVSCRYQEIHRDTSSADEHVDSRFTFGSVKNLSFGVPLETDFIWTSCIVKGVDSAFDEYLALTPLKHGVEERCAKSQASKPLKKPLNVIFLGIDSISSLNFLRHFPKCNNYLSSFLFPTTLKGYTKVGDNTFPNLMPLLTGHFHQFYYDEKHNKSMFFDNVDFSWKMFAKYGYRTLLAEDAPRINTFNYYRNGFRDPPTDYYYRPFALATESSYNKHCFGSKMEMELLYDYLKSFVDTMGIRPFFAFVFLARLTHDLMNFAGYADEPTFQLLRYLEESGALEKTALVFYSDHGIRYGPIRKTYIGQFEERMPFMNIILPKWFLEEHKDLSDNLKTNSERLTTPFDIHSTIMDLVSVITGDASLQTRDGPGLSLFRDIPEDRTCSKAAITPHWCPCQIHRAIPTTDATVVEAAETVIRTLNNWTSLLKDKCAMLSLDSILNARAGSDSNEIGGKLNYLVVLSVFPSEAIFEATVRCDTEGKKSCQVVDDVSRINEYGTQSKCITDTVLKKFCYCLT